MKNFLEFYFHLFLAATSLMIWILIDLPMSIALGTLVTIGRMVFSSAKSDGLFTKTLSPRSSRFSSRLWFLGSIRVSYKFILLHYFFLWFGKGSNLRCIYSQPAHAVTCHGYLVSAKPFYFTN